jgi:aspartyl/asparaginyl beta-hydroxylase (cupin superfamily)
MLLEPPAKGLDEPSSRSIFPRSILGRGRFGARRPTFFDPGLVCPALNQLTRNYAAIRKEWEGVERLRSSMPLYHAIDPGQTKIAGTIDSEKDWRVLMLYLLGYKPPHNRSLCPETCVLLDRIPTLVQAFFSILDPGKNVPVHEGPYLGYLRYHLGIKVPSDNAPALVVNGKQYIWREGEAVMFDDSWPHPTQRERNFYFIGPACDVPRLALEAALIT